MYEQYKVDRGRKEHWAMYPCPAKIPVVYEPLPGMPPHLESAEVGKKPNEEEVRKTILVREPLRFFKPQKESGDSQIVSQQFPIYRMREKDGFFATGQFQPSTIDDHAVFSTRLATPAETVTNVSFHMATPPFGGFPNVIPPGSPANWSIGLRIDEHKQKTRVGNIHLVGNTVERIGSISRNLPHLARLFPQSGGLGDTKQYVSTLDDLAIKDLKEAVTGSLLFGIPSPPASGGGGTPDIQEQVSEPQVALSEFSQSLLYQRPSFLGEDRLFYDLVSYAPGMNTSWADVASTLEAEAEANPPANQGRIDAAARKLIDRARAVDWRAYTIFGKTDQPTFKITFDGSGRFAYERIVPPGLRERVVCDGETLMHLYPDLGIGSRRKVSRFHRAQLVELIPWSVPPADDLARDGDLQVIDEHTLAVLPVIHSKSIQKGAKGHHQEPDGKSLQIHLVFGADSRLAERQIVEMPGRKILLRQICETSGTVKWLDVGGKELAVQKGTLSTAQTPDLNPDTKNLVVLPLPYRSREYIRKTLKIENKSNQDLRFDEALALFAASLASGDSNAVTVFKEAFKDRNQAKLGFYVLLAAAGNNLDAEHVDVLSEQLNEPLAQYLGLYSSPVLRKHASQWAVGTSQWSSGFLHHLAVTHALYQIWQSDKPDRNSSAGRARALDYIRQNKGSLFGWGLLCLLQDRAGKDQMFYAAIAEAWPWFEDLPQKGLNYAARYEHARSLWKAGKKSEARRRFQELYEKTLQENQLPLLDGDFRQALAGEGQEPDLWSELIRQSADYFIKQKRRSAVLALAWQCWQLDDSVLAGELLSKTVEGVTDAAERMELNVAGLGFLIETGQWVQADQLLPKLVAEAKPSQRAYLWRLGAVIASKRDMQARKLECLEQALKAEFENLPEVFNLKTVRDDYQELLNQYLTLADAMVTLKIATPPDFQAKVLRTADRWRFLDKDAAAACEATAKIFFRLGERELAWDYLTSQVAFQPSESEPWLNLAITLNRQGDLELADRAYAAAFEAEPTNAQILWDRARNLRQGGKTVEAQRIYRQMAEGKWSARYLGIQAQARHQGQER